VFHLGLQLSDLFLLRRQLVIAASQSCFYLLKPFIDLDEFESPWVKSSTQPLHQAFMFFMLWIFHCVEELEVTTQATHIFRWACHFATDADHTRPCRCQWQPVFKGDCVPPAITVVVEIFKSSFSPQYGLDVALEALRDGWSARNFTMDELMRYVEICRVKKVMQPYLQSLV